MPPLSRVIEELAPSAEEGLTEAMAGRAKALWSAISQQSVGESVAALKVSTTPSSKRAEGAAVELHKFADGIIHLDMENGDWLRKNQSTSKIWARRDNGHQEWFSPEFRTEHIDNSGSVTVEAGGEVEYKEWHVRYDQTKPVPIPDPAKHEVEVAPLSRDQITVFGDGTLMSKTNFNATRFITPAPNDESEMDRFVRGPVSFATYRNEQTGVETTHFSTGDRIVVTPQGQRTFMVKGVEDDPDGFKSVSTSNMFTGRHATISNNVREDFWNNGLLMTEHPTGVVTFAHSANLYATFDQSGNMIKEAPTRGWGFLGVDHLLRRKATFNSDSVHDGGPTLETKLKNGMSLLENAGGDTKVYAGGRTPLWAFTAHRDGTLEKSPLLKMMKQYM